MRLKALPLLLVISIIAATSCQREIDNIVTNRLQSDSVLLDRLVFLDTTLPHPFDSISWYKIIHDPRDRISKAFYIENNIGTLDTTEKFDYFYLGNDTLPYKIQGQSSNENWTGYKFYDNTGRVIKDSSLYTYITGMHVIAVVKYTYRNGYVIRERNSDAGPGNVYHYIDTTYQTRVGQNILTQTDTSFSGSGYVVNLNYQYDNRPNPLRGLSLGHSPSYQGEETLEENWSDNNFLETYTERKELNPPSILDVDHYAYTYLYGSNGMPKIAWEREVNYGIVDKYVFIYTK